MGDDKAVGFGREPFTAIGFRPLIRWLSASRAALVAFICQTDEEGQGSVVEGQGSGTSHGARPVGHAIPHQLVVYKRGLLVRCCMGCLYAATLIDGDIDGGRTMASWRQYVHG